MILYSPINLLYHPTTTATTREIKTSSGIRLVQKTKQKAQDRYLYPSPNWRLKLNYYKIIKAKISRQSLQGSPS